MNTDHGSGWSRRDFVRVAGAAAFMPLAACEAAPNADSRRAPSPGAPPPAPRDDRLLKVGLIGCGGRGTGAALQALKADPTTVLWAAADVFADRLNACLNSIKDALDDKADAQLKVGAERRFLGFDAYQKVIDSGVDVVILTSYPVFRPQHMAAAVAAGKHVFAEKPIAVDAPGVRSFMESCRKAKEKNLAVVVGFCWRYNDGMRATFDQIHNGVLGDLVTVQTTYYTGTLEKRPRKPEWSDLEFQLRNWWHFAWVSGDHIVEQAVHSIDRLAWATGDRTPKRVICLGGRAARSGPEHGDVFDHFSAVYEYDDGMRAFHACRQIDGCPSDNTDYVYGTRGSAVINGWVPTYVVKDRAGKEAWKYQGRTDRDMYQNEHDELFASIRAGRPINDGERGARSTLLAIMARMAAYTGQTITWDQALNSSERLAPERLEFGERPTGPVPIPGKTKFS